jgi:membrane protein YdbS with pleckstrin-like domain
MVCRKCGAEAPAKAAFCPQCGTQLGRAGSDSGSRPAKAARMEPAGGRKVDAPEEELWTGVFSPKAMTGSFIVAALLTIAALIGASFVGPPGVTAVGVGALVAFGYLVLSLIHARLSVHYRLTTHRLVVQRGILAKADDRILLVDIDDITARQGLIERMLGIGTVVLHTSDETTKEDSPDPGTPNRGVLMMRGIENPREVGDMIDEARRAERSRRGVYMMNA